MTNEPQDITRLERGMDKINDKLDNVMQEIVNIRVQGAQHFSKLENHEQDIKSIREDLSKHKETSDNNIKKLEIEHSNLKTKIGPIFMGLAALLSVIITKIVGSIWPS